MAERRMFAKTIIDSDSFLDMPLSTQALYFHLSMRADDEGFVNNPKKIARMIGADDDSIKLLIMKKFIIPFESGIVVIKHWRMHNYIQNDRFKPTAYQDERQTLTIKENGAYTSLSEESTLLTDKCIQNGYSLDTQYSIGKDSIGKDNINTAEKPQRYAEEVEEIVSYLNEKAGTKYRAKTEATRRHIVARLNDGFSVDDFKEVIDKKCAGWIGTDYQKYLRPETLFGSKFESYLNENSKRKEETHYAGIDAECCW